MGSYTGEHMTTISEAGHLRSESRDAYLDVSFDLLRAMADVHDIRTVPPRLSDIVKPLLPHDAVAVVLRDEHGHPVVEASTGDFLAMTPQGLQLPPDRDLIVQVLREVPLEQGAGGVAPACRERSSMSGCGGDRARAGGPRGGERGRVKEPPRRGDVHRARAHPCDTRDGGGRGEGGGGGGALEDRPC